jgi:poly(3-hydroxybutyrate) depolymerase
VADDLLFTADILNQLERDYPVDTQRIYATGKSDGASFTNTLACDFRLSRRIAAFAPVSGAYYVDSEECDAETVLSYCNPGRSTIPIIEFHGKADEVVAFNGGERNGHCLPSIPQFMRNWAMRNSLGLKNTITQTRRDTFVTKYGSDFDYGLVTLVVDNAIGHDWPVSN